MPNINTQTIDSVVVLFNVGGSAIGTGFVAQFMGDDGSSNYYIITCQHCIGATTRVRFKSCTCLNVQEGDWSIAASGDDIAAIDITDLMIRSPGATGSINLNDSVADGQPHFGVGVDIYMLGLLTEQRDVGRNLIRARFGNLSAAADATIPLEQGNGQHRPCHLGDMRSRPGFSGSPVLAYIDIPVFGGIRNRTLFLGVHSGQGRDRVSIYGMSNYRDVEIASSITRIVPSWEISTHLTNDARLRDLRAARVAAAPSVGSA